MRMLVQVCQTLDQVPDEVSCSEGIIHLGCWVGLLVKYIPKVYEGSAAEQRCAHLARRWTRCLTDELQLQLLAVVDGSFVRMHMVPWLLVSSDLYIGRT
jgi:hypothetical protein